VENRKQLKHRRFITMSNCTINPVTRRFSACVPLAAIGVKLRGMDLFGPIAERVQIAQKTVKHTPVQKLYDGFVAILAGAQGLVEINKRLRSEPALQAAFGRKACAEQSVVQDTLDACTAVNVRQMQQATALIYRRHSLGYRHHYGQGYQLLDVDMTGMPCGPKAAFASKGYFAHQRNRRGRQLGRVLATGYDEIVVDRLFNGKTQLTTALRPLVEAAEDTLALDAEKRARTILRVDAGGGSVDDVNWMLARGYQFHGKDYSGQRARVLAESVTQWVDDPKVPGRQVGWVTVVASAYIRPVKRLAVRCRKKNGQWGIGVLLSTLTAQEAILLTRQPIDRVTDPLAVLLAYVYFYDQRSGGVETSNKEDKQGLGITKRNKKRFEAQQMLVQLNALAHNVIVWTRCWLAPHYPKLQRFGIKRMIRDVFHCNGWMDFDHTAHISQIGLNHADPLAAGLVQALSALLASEHIAITSGEI
jgi:hypothetical protein